jgi:hypothetical protein
LAEPTRSSFGLLRQDDGEELAGRSSRGEGCEESVVRLA